MPERKIAAPLAQAAPDVDGRAVALFVSSSGGVLLDLLALEGHFSNFSIVWAVVRAEDTLSALSGRTVNWIDNVSLQHPWRMAASFRYGHKLLRRINPGLIVSAGSGPAFPFFALARLRGLPSFWISTLNIHDREGVAARLCARLASRIFIQQPSLLRSASRAIFIGELY